MAAGLPPMGYTGSLADDRLLEPSLLTGSGEPPFEVNLTSNVQLNAYIPAANYHTTGAESHCPPKLASSTPVLLKRTQTVAVQVVMLPHEPDMKACH